MFVSIVLALNAPDPALWGREALTMIRRDYYLPKTKLYAEKPDRKQPAFNWGVGVMLSALNAAAKHDKKYRPWLKEYADASRVYWNKGGYDVLPAPKPLDRYYDDNAWMVLALVETYEVLGDKKYLKWAREALAFALEGEAKDGGIYWRESDKASRNTCSNAPVAAACLALAKHQETERLSAKAEEIFEWTYQNLRDPTDGLYWDSLSNTGKIDKTKWTYNTALMIRASQFRETAFEETLNNSTKRWLVNGKLADSGRFAHLLLEAWVGVHGVKPEYVRALENVRKARSANGYYPSNWSELKAARNPELLDQAAFARACFVVAGKLP